MRNNTCFVIQAKTGRKCTWELLLSIFAPTYLGILYVQSKNKDFE